MIKTIVTALRVTLFTLLVTGIAYPLAATGGALVLFPAKANGSLVEEDGQVVGSELIAQRFATPAYLQPRPSAAGENGYDATASSGSNLGTTSRKLAERITADLERLRAENPDAPFIVPDALVTASASGLDPDLSPEAARWQIPRIAKARHLAPERVRAAIDAHVENRNVGIFGEPRLNVLIVNLALDRQFGRPPALPGNVAPGAAREPRASVPAAGALSPDSK